MTDQELATKLLPFMQAAARGETVEIKRFGDWVKVNISSLNPEELRIKPKLVEGWVHKDNIILKTEITTYGGGAFIHVKEVQGE